MRKTKIATKLFGTHNKIKLWSVEISITMSGTNNTRGDTLDEAMFCSWNMRNCNDLPSSEQKI
jgi:hypothetical protein